MKNCRINHKTDNNIRTGVLCNSKSDGNYWLNIYGVYIHTTIANDIMVEIPRGVTHRIRRRTQISYTAKRRMHNYFNEFLKARFASYLSRQFVDRISMKYVISEWLSTDKKREKHLYHTAFYMTPIKAKNHRPKRLIGHLIILSQLNRTVFNVLLLFLTHMYNNNTHRLRV